MLLKKVYDLSFYCKQMQNTSENSSRDQIVTIRMIYHYFSTTAVIDIYNIVMKMYELLSQTLILVLIDILVGRISIIIQYNLYLIKKLEFVIATFMLPEIFGICMTLSKHIQT